MTYCKEVGLKVGDKIVYTGLGTYMRDHSNFKIGETLTLIKDDGSDSPLFYNNEIEDYFDLQYRQWKKYEEKSPLFGKKYKVNPEVSELLQKAVFEAGGKWLNGINIVCCLDYKYIFVREDGTMYIMGSSQSRFLEEQLPEGILEVEKKLVLKDVIEVGTPQQKEYKELLAKIEEHKQSLVALEEQAKKLSNN